MKGRTPASSRSGERSMVSPAGRRPSPRSRSRFSWVRLLLLLGLGGALFAATSIAVVLLYYGLDPDLPRIDHIGDYRPLVVTRILDRNGELLGEIAEERRTVVPRDKIPPVMIHAIVDAEDAQFYEHKGLNYLGMLRAFLNNVQPGTHKQGGSTITQQLVKTYVIKSNERTLRRKAQEVILARRLEQALTKDEILYLYLNQIYFGHNRYGIEEAARFYFGKSIADVNAGEAAVLASLPKGPEEISPIKHPARAKDRQRYVLSQMLRYNHVTRAEAERWANAPIQVVRPPAALGVAPEFVDEVRRQLVAQHGDKLPYLGLTVTTTCDARIQKLAREALERRLEELDERQGYRKPAFRPRKPPSGPAAVRTLLEERALKQLYKLNHSPTAKQKAKWVEERTGQALESGRAIEAVLVELRTQGDQPGAILDSGGTRGFLPLPARKDRYNPKALGADKRYQVGDVLVVRAEPSLGRTAERLPILVPEFGPQAAAFVVDPATREVRAMVGGYGFRPGSFNRATRAMRQPGSAFKPFLYATAFASGRYTPATILNDSPQVEEQPGLAPWIPKNAESHEFLGPVRLRVALAKSLNTVAAQLVADLTPEALVEMAHNLGIESKLDPHLSLGIGAAEVTLAELTNAYTAFATGGQRAPLVFVRQMGTETTPPAAPQQAITPEIAYLVTSLMESVIDEGTAASAKGRLKRPAAGKTGTTNSERDAWFVGFTPDLVTGAWVGFDDMRDLGHGEQGARSALPIWTDIMIGALKGAPPRPFTQPPGIVIARIDPTTGLLAPPGAPSAIDEKFIDGTAPTETAPEQGTQNPDTFIIDQQ